MCIRCSAVWLEEDMSIEQVLQVLISGALLGGLYALMAFGLSIIYGVVRVLNFAHGTILAIAGVLASVLFTALGWSPVAIIVVLAPMFALFGYVFFSVLIRPLLQRSAHEAAVGAVLVTAGALVVLTDLMVKLAGSTQRNIRLQSGILEIGDVILPMNQVYILAGVATVAILLQVVMKKTWFGRALRAVTQDPLGARVCAIREDRIKLAAFAVGTGLTAIAGTFYVMTFPVDPYVGLPLSVKAFTIIVLGGIGSFVGTLVAGVCLGLAEGLTGFFWRPEWSPALSIVLLLFILTVFPRKQGS